MNEITKEANELFLESYKSLSTAKKHLCLPDFIDNINIDDDMTEIEKSDLIKRLREIKI